MLIQTLETISSALVGEPVPMSDTPKLFMAQSLGNMLERMDERQLEQFSRIADPFVVITCTALYAGQIMNVMKEKKAREAAESAQSESESSDDSGDHRSGGGRGVGMEKDTLPIDGFRPRDI